MQFVCAGSAGDATFQVQLLATPLSRAAVAAAAANHYAIDIARQLWTCKEARIVFELILQHYSTTAKPMGADALIVAAAAAAGVRLDYVDKNAQRSVRRQLLTAAFQHDSAAAHVALAALQQQWPPGPRYAAALMLMAGMLLELWGEAAAEAEKLDSQLPTRQQMLVCVAAEHER
jgi:hypothetical protein